EAARDDMRAVRYRLWHVSPPLLSCSFSAPRRILRGARKGLRRVFSVTTLLRRNKCRCPRAVLHDDPGLVLMVLNKRQQKDGSRLLEARQSAYNHCAIAPLLNTANGLTVNAIAGSYVVLLGLNITDALRPGLRGFAIKRTDHTENESYWMSGTKVFESVEP